ncbi:MAG: ketoacyl-ACP synthase III [Butyrivibrio sp.]|nr:ketoacyl-ACP synthase III [Butyrivibrio sp.]
MKGLKIISTGSAIPSRNVTNDDLAQVVETNDEWIFTRTGIHSRYFCNEEESTLTLATDAARKAIENSGINKDDIGCIICATLSGDYASPSLSCMVQACLSLPQDIPVLDVNAACSGFLYGLEVCRGMLNATEGKYGLVIGAEQLSRILDMQDRSTCVLFGDGAGAVIVEAAQDAYYDSVLGAKGGKQILINGIGNKAQYIEMDGKEVFKFAVDALPKCIRKLQEKQTFTLDDIDHVICHQANSRIIDHCIKKLKADPDKFYKNMDHFGNTSAASIPLALAEMDEKNMIKSGDKLLLIGFGGGLTWAGTLITKE